MYATLTQFRLFLSNGKKNNLKIYWQTKILVDLKVEETTVTKPQCFKLGFSRNFAYGIGTLLWRVFEFYNYYPSSKQRSVYP